MSSIFFFSCDQIMPIWINIHLFIPSGLFSANDWLMTFGYKLPYRTFQQGEGFLYMMKVGALEGHVAAAPALFSMLYEVPPIIATPIFCYLFVFSLFLCIRGNFPTFLSDSLWFPVYCIRGPVEPAAGKHVLTWTTLLNWLTMTERERPQSVWLCASGRHVFLFVHLVNSCAHFRRCVWRYICLF